jgi:hypothetical protein
MKQNDRHPGGVEELDIMQTIEGKIHPMNDPRTIAALSDCSRDVRQQALAELTKQATFASASDNVNLHFHSFFSYNAEGWSPVRIAWESRQAGLYAAGLCDFDVLDGLDEFFAACDLLELRGTVNVETRAYLAEYASSDINSPGEPGVTYIMGGGFAGMPKPGTPAADGLAGYRRRAQERNVALVTRINANLAELAIDYERDVVPLSPGGCPTERHIISAYVNHAAARHSEPSALAAFWAGLLGVDSAAATNLLTDRPALEEKVRSKLAKRGGLGYEAPTPKTFPRVEDFVAWVKSCRAIPMVTWLDGTSAGEKDAKAMLECLRAKGCAALNIIPDRNWNLKPGPDREAKIANLTSMVREADAMGLPINIGTEMNRAGLPFCDDLDGEVLRPFKVSFVRGAEIMVGHTRLLRHAGFSYSEPEAAAAYPDIHRRNEFFRAVGALPPPSESVQKRLAEMSQEKAFAFISDAVRAGAWK